MKAYKSKWHELLHKLIDPRVRKLGLMVVALLVGVTSYYLLRLSSASPIKDTGPRTDISNINVDSLTGPGEAIVSKTDLHDSHKKQIAMQLVSSAENSTQDWRAQFGYIEDIGDGRGYTAGLIGFCSGTGDMLKLVEKYTQLQADNPLAQYLPALHNVNSTDSHTGLGKPFEAAWRKAASDSLFQQAQESERDRVYFDPAVKRARADGLSLLGQFMYYDAAVVHGSDAWGGGMPDIRNAAIKVAKTPAQGGDEAAYLATFLNKRIDEMNKDSKHRDLSRIETAQRKFLNDKNFNLDVPLRWSVYGDKFSIMANPNP